MDRMVSSTNLLDDGAALRERVSRAGYVYLAGAMDLSVIDQVRDAMVDILTEHDLATLNDEGQVVFTGTDDESLGIRSPNWLVQEYIDRRLAQMLMDCDAHRAIFEAVAGEEIMYLPITEFRSRPPGAEPLTWHQDGFYNSGLDLFTAWIPLCDIPHELGGLAVADGAGRDSYLHEQFPPPKHLIPEDAIDASIQRRGDYRPGDVVVFDRHLPHTGLPNLTKDRLRMSIDIRFQGVSAGQRVVIGHITRSDGSSVTIEADNGDVTTLDIAGSSRLRDWWGFPVAPSEIAGSALGEGRSMATHDDGEIILLRPVAV